MALLLFEKSFSGFLSYLRFLTCHQISLIHLCCCKFLLHWYHMPRFTGRKPQRAWRPTWASELFVLRVKLHIISHCKVVSCKALLYQFISHPAVDQLHYGGVSWSSLTITRCKRQKENQARSTMEWGAHLITEQLPIRLLICFSVIDSDASLYRAGTHYTEGHFEFQNPFRLTVFCLFVCLFFLSF